MTPSLIGVIHLAALPGSPRARGDIGLAIETAASDARRLKAAGFDGIIVENFGDAPFFPGSVPAVTVAAMTACAIAVQSECSGLSLGINVLRNDAEAALSIAIASRANFVRINVHTGARVTDQGLVLGQAHDTLRARRALDAQSVKLFCDVDVKHSAPLAPRPIAEEARDLEGRGLADAVLVTGSGTGIAATTADLESVADAVHVPVFVASGVTEKNLAAVTRAHGVIVGSCLRRSGKAGDPIDEDLARRFADAYRRSRAP